MNTFNFKKYILKLINENEKGVEINLIINYLDYINKVHYNINDIEIELNTLIMEGEIVLKGNFYYSTHAVQN